MEQIAILSDIHGNLEALNAVLIDIHKRQIHKMICLGDIIAKGTHSKECVDLIKKNCEIVLQGNCEHYYTQDFDLNTLTKQERDRILWNQAKLYKETLHYLKRLPYSYEFYMSGRLVRLFHAHPEKIDKIISNRDTLDHQYELFLSSPNTLSDKKADIVIYGHIHMPYVQHLYNKTIINTGSVGNDLDLYRDDKRDGPIYNTTVAHYLILKGALNSQNYDDLLSYELVSVPYDIIKN